MELILRQIRDNLTIKLPDYDPGVGNPGGHPFALIGIEENPFSGVVGEFRYQFEGEEDLLHLMVMRCDCEPLTPQEGQQVASFVLRGLPSSLIWLRPGQRSQHFYFGHDELLSNLQL
ncbi:MAG TPA: hypothetical protein VGE01_06615 [Fimbriimonas sp.]